MEEIVDSGFAGVQLRVHDERGEWAGSAGVRKLGESAEPPTNGHFRIGSTTKTFTATVVLRLVAEGKIGLDGPADDYLPEFGLDRRITVRMLLQHTSGLFNHTGEYYDDGTVAPGIPWQGQEYVDNQFHTYQPEELVRLALRGRGSSGRCSAAGRPSRLTRRPNRLSRRGRAVQSGPRRCALDHVTASRNG